MIAHSASEKSQHPLLYQVFARVWLEEMSTKSGTRVTLATVPDALLDHIAGNGFRFVYLMGVWKLGDEGRRRARDPMLYGDYDRALPGWSVDDIVGSPFAVAGWNVAGDLGG